MEKLVSQAMGFIIAIVLTSGGILIYLDLTPFWKVFTIVLIIAEVMAFITLWGVRKALTLDTKLIVNKCLEAPDSCVNLRTLGKELGMYDSAGHTQYVDAIKVSNFRDIKALMKCIEEEDFIKAESRFEIFSRRLGKL